MKDESIFPTINYENHQNGDGVAYTFPLDEEGQRGLTKRELFAAIAIQGAARDIASDPARAELVEKAVQIADNLIKELKKAVKND